MKRFILSMLLCGVLCAPLLARSGRHIYTAGCKATAATTAVVTIEVAADTTKDVRILLVETYLEDSPGDVTLARDATTITGGAGLAETKTSAYHGESAVPAAQATAKCDPAVSGETDLPVARPIPAAGSIVLAPHDVELVAGENFAVSAAADSADSITVVVTWEEIPVE